MAGNLRRRDDLENVNGGVKAVDQALLDIEVGGFSESELFGVGKRKFGGL